MAKKKTSTLPKNDFAPEEELDISGFTSEPIAVGDCISSFSFDDDSIEEVSISSDKNNAIAISPEVTKTMNFDSSYVNNKYGQITVTSADRNILEDNRKTPIANGMAPPINGEYLDTKRTYMLRNSTVRKLNELKSIHPEINTYVSTIVDMAIAHYYNYIINEGGKQ